MTRTFKLVRDVDVSGVSGIGVVCEGVIFSDGHAAIHWIDSPHPTTTPHPDGLDSVMYVHGHGGKTRLVWDDDGVAPADFSEEDITFLHDVLSLTGMDSHISERARKLLGKVRTAMTGQTVP